MTANDIKAAMKAAKAYQAAMEKLGAKASSELRRVNALTSAQLRDLKDIIAFIAENPTWTVPELRTTKALVIAGCLTRTPGSVTPTDLGRATVTGVSP